MPARITDRPKLTPRGTVFTNVEITPETRQELVRIALRRGETMTDILRKAVEQYVAADKRRKR